MISFPARDYYRILVNNDFIIVGALIILWLFLVFLVNPLGNFPLNDDWAFGWTVNNLLATGQFKLSDWAAANLLSQVLIATAFTLPFDFSFTALRICTLTLGLTGVLVTYGLLRETEVSPGIATCGALVLALNPLYFCLANSFMTDVPTFTFFMSSTYCIIRGLNRQSVLLLSAGVLLSYLAILNRQSSIIIIPAFILAYLLNRGLTARTIRNAVVSGTGGLALYLAYPQWLKFTGRVPVMYNMQVDQLLMSYSGGLSTIVATYVRNAVNMGVYMGLFLLPFSIVVFPLRFNRLSAWQKQKVALPTAFVVVVAAVCFAMNKSMPLSGNILNFFDVGGQSLPGYQSFLDPDSLASIRRLWTLLTILGVIGAALLVSCALRSTLSSGARGNVVRFAISSIISKNWLPIFVTSLIFMYLLGIAGLEKGYWFDRYLILLLPLLMIVAAMFTSKLSRTKIGVGVIGSVAVLLLFYGGVTIAGTHDHLASNRVLWEAVKSAMESGKVKPDEIDGGFEFNGWYFGNNLKTCNPAYARNRKPTGVDFIDFTCLYENKHWRYMMSYTTEAGFVIEAQYSFRRWLPWRNQTLYLLRRLP
jgi:Dolichyl-phosphate-mannose-protein mannosyltransferase